jgi:hypothetical protein
MPVQKVLTMALSLRQATANDPTFTKNRVDRRGFRHEREAFDQSYLWKGTIMKRAGVEPRSSNSIGRGGAA